ncbi:NB-ARC domain-containing protein, partial [Priestia aryabhattai]
HKNYLLSLTGDGGIGKTSIAYKVAYQVKEHIAKGESEFDDVIWISAKDQRIYFDERRQLYQEFSSMEDLYNKILVVFYDKKFIQGLDFPKKEEHVNQALESAKFFLVLDNLEVFSNEELRAIHDFIKNAPLGHKFLLTSRHDLRVQEFIPVQKFDESISKIYISDLIHDLVIKEKMPKIQWEISDNFTAFYSVTNGNPLYIKFFIAQMARNRDIKDILNRRNLEGEKPLKAYCFDSTLSNLNANELLLMYSLAVTENNQLNFYALKYITLIEHSELQRTLESLCSHSMLYKEYQNGQEIYSLNNLLRSYLIEEKRIPGAEYSRLHQKSRKISNYDKDINEKLAFNFGLTNKMNNNECMSYNMILESLDNGEIPNEEHLQAIMTLYPGNYLVSFYKNFTKIKSNNINPYNIYSEINSEFAHIISMNQYDEQIVMSYVWKSALYIMLEKYDDVTKDIDYVMETYETEHKNLLGVLKASALNMLAVEAYRYNRYSKHDQYRENAQSLFQEHFSGFLSKPYFFFLKRYMCFSYNKHNQHMQNNIKKVTDYAPFERDLLLLKNQKL